MDYKIIKYKLKKKKLESKINEILISRKKLYLSNISNSINKIKFISEIITELIDDKQTQTHTKQSESNSVLVPNIIYIIVSGIYASGKSTLISELENFFGESNILAKINLSKKEEISLIEGVKKN